MESTIRRLERVEERLIQAERDVALLTSKLSLSQDELSRRIDEINTNLKEDAERNRVDLRERLADLKGDIKEDISGLSATIQVLTDNITEASTSLQSLHVTQKGSSTKVKTNERIIWGVVTVIGTVALYLIQNFIKGGA